MDKVLFAGTAVTREGAVGSLYRLAHGGEWEKAADIPADAAVQAIVQHPACDHIVFAATRKGIYKSEDRGAHWRNVGASADPKIQFWSVEVDPRDPDHLFAGTSPIGVFESRDCGETWTACEVNHPERFNIRFGASRVMRLAFHPADPDVLYGIAEINGFMLSTDGGKTWNARPEGLVELAGQEHLRNKIETDDETEGMFDAHAVTTTPAAPDSLFYLCRMGVFESRDQGRTFEDLAVRNFAPFSYCRDLRVAAGQPRKLYACFSIASRSNAGAVYASDDLGRNWRRADPQMTARSTIMGINVHKDDGGGVISVTRGGQVFYTFDGGENWVEKQLPAEAGDAFCAAMI
ncbi:Dispase autolysis-inducing protein precursor [Pigmentiphaga humi]|uniref:Dispase autolysis-inducing protein n=1 Tax=Pigmentiphaga humi TaxID=2478468 RepID=A0A3P4AYC8_9BURK|nr:sialidase family protein [Pigmentiphaga humi]VCU69047.1 Dispase autolysis-inducing protein precursor [Pigmentiphaga humi]